MKTLFKIFFLVFYNLFVYAQSYSIFPIHESRYHPTTVPIIIRPGYSITDNLYAQFASLELHGSKSGRVSYQLYRSADRKAITYMPNRPFIQGEQVHYSLMGMKDVAGNRVNIECTFYIESAIVAPLLASSSSREGSQLTELPLLRIKGIDSVYNAPIFGTSFLDGMRYFVLNTLGDVDFVADSDHFIVNFQQHNDSTYSITDKSVFVGGHILLNKHFIPTDTVRVPEGYELDFHDFRINAAHNYLVITDDVHSVDMSLIYPGGNTNAFVKSNSIVELDSATKLPINIWRAIDHFSVLDGVHDNINTPNLNFTASIISFTHANSVQETHDGYWILSCKNMDEITKIDPQTGNIVWRLGGKNNQFRFVNDSLNGVSNQHHATLLPNNHLLIHDNGLFHNSPIARVVEYAINETDSTATLVFSACHPNGDKSLAGGSHQRLPNGNHFVSWGSLYDNQPYDIFLSEYDSLGNAVNYISLDSSVAATHTPYIYRAYKYNWSSTDTIPTDTIPTDTIPIDTVPIDTVPIDTVPIDTVPTDTTTDTTTQSVDLIFIDGNVYPLPCKDIINIRLPRSVAWLPPNRTRLYSTLGHFYEPPQQVFDSNTLQLSLRDYPPGIYLLSISYPNWNKTFKILKL